MSQHIVSLYDTHEGAVEAVQLLKNAGFNEKTHQFTGGEQMLATTFRFKMPRLPQKGWGLVH